jgi:hypothetical protein
VNFKEQCEDFLCRLFASVVDDVLKVVEGDAASKEWGYTDDEAQSIAKYLEEKGLITRHLVSGGVGGIALAAEGIDYTTNEC